MDDQAALIARHVAMAATARFNAPADVESYLLAAAVGDVERLGLAAAGERRRRAARP